LIAFFSNHSGLSAVNNYLFLIGLQLIGEQLNAGDKILIVGNF